MMRRAPAEHPGAVARRFAPAAARLELQPLGRGLINDTYLVSEGAGRWVLQRLNRQVFTDPLAVMANFRTVTEHARQSRRDCPESSWRLPEIIPTQSGDDVHQDEQGEYWRAITYIDQTHGLTAIASPDQAVQIGRALGWFHELVSGLPVTDFHDTLPGFHVTPRYLAEFDAVLAERPGGPAVPGLDEALAVVASRRAAADVLETARAQGRLKPQVIHGDPKLDNVLFDIRSGQAISLIDLDTVKPGLLHYDVGDCCRSACNPGGEGANPSAVRFDLELFGGFLQGYRQEGAPLVAGLDRDYLFEAVRLLPFELGLRFLTDHLAGDIYFKVGQSGQNLTRALTQFRLMNSIEAQARDIHRLLSHHFS